MLKGQVKRPCEIQLHRATLLLLPLLLLLLLPRRRDARVDADELVRRSSEECSVNDVGSKSVRVISAVSAPAQMVLRLLTECSDSLLHVDVYGWIDGWMGERGGSWWLLSSRTTPLPLLLLLLLLRQVRSHNTVRLNIVGQLCGECVRARVSRV